MACDEAYIFNTQEIVCPYCDFEYSDSWEYPDSCIVKCCECDGEFISERETTVAYSTSKYSYNV